MRQTSPNADAASWTLLLGPGPRTEGLGPLLAALSAAREAPEPRLLADLSELLAEPLPAAADERGRLLLDCDSLAIDDVGLVRRFLGARPGWEAWLLGEESGTRSARRLAAVTNTRWLDWPLDVDQLAAALAPPPPLVSPTPRSLPLPPPPASEGPCGEPRGSEEPALEQPTRGDRLPEEVPSSGRLARHHLQELEEDLEAIEEILAQEEDPPEGELDPESWEAQAGAHPDGEPDRSALDLTPEEIAAFFEPSDAAPGPASPLEGGAGGEQSHPSPGAAATLETERLSSPADDSTSPLAGLPTWYKDQVADLADRAQRLYLTLTREEELGPTSPFAQEVLGLTQFARTLGYLVAPPRQGDLSIELAPLLEVSLSTLRGARRDGPRYLLRPCPQARVRADKELLCLAFDTLLQLADACSGPDDVVRVALDARDGVAQVVIRFSAGPLRELPPARILTPYALRRILPRIGPNALAAAGRILAGQGGRLSARRGPEEGEVVLEVELPLI